jgi:hypothetical protein
LESYLSFLDEATYCFLDAFAVFETISGLAEKERTLAGMAPCVRGLYVAMEKGLKHAVSRIDPYLLIAKPDRTLLLDIRKDLVARQAPSIFCSRQPFETTSLVQTWDTLRSLDDGAVDADIVADFDRALRRVADLRNRLQHGELLSEVEEVRAAVEQLLARFKPIASEWAPDWLEAMCSRNGQLASRLQAIENKVDRNWQVLIDYLRTSGPIDASIVFFTMCGPERDSVETLFGKSSGGNSLLGGGTVPRSAVAGELFSAFLSEQQALDRRSERRRRRALLEAAGLGAEGAPASALVPLDFGRITVASTNAWLSLHLPDVTPHQLSFSATLVNLTVQFDDADGLLGRAEGRIECSVQRGNACLESVDVIGVAYLDSEHYMEAEPNAVPPTSEYVQRRFTLELQLVLFQRAEGK